MNVPSQRVADYINKNQSDSAAWIARHLLDDALELLSKPNCAASEMGALLEWGKDRLTELIESQAICTVKGMQQ